MCAPLLSFPRPVVALSGPTRTTHVAQTPPASPAKGVAAAGDTSREKTMKWIKGMMAAVGLAVATVGTAHGAGMTSATFTMLDPGGGNVGVDTTVTGAIGGGTWSVASTTTFFGLNWTAHGGTLKQPGTYTIATVPPDGTYTGPGYTGVVVGPGQVGGHILFDWGTTTNIDVINVWDVSVFGGVKTYTSKDPTVTGPTANPDGKPGVGMIDGPFPGFNANFDFTVDSCGDGVVDTAANTTSIDAEEACDDGNTTGGDGCAADCSAVESGYTCSTPGSPCTTTCGDGIVAGSEACDDGNIIAGDGCSDTCTVESGSGWTCDGASPTVCQKCGNGRVEGTEACDDSNTTSGDGCSSTCTVESGSGWTCDGASPTVCYNCGDSVLEGPETCDDGNPTGGDGCSATCQTESGFVCTGAGPGSCVPGCTGGSPNGTLETNEQCDDGNNTDTDGCNNSCRVNPGYDCTLNGTGGSTCSSTCGDGVKASDIDEACDDGNTIVGDGCSDTCTVESGWTCDGASPTVCQKCGNGQVEGTETCDDGNTLGSDGCAADCSAVEWVHLRDAWVAVHDDVW